ncbi:hypothetical protein FGM00_15515 [Aggregatimonas sangjinii]|uniref:Fibronectin type-III domain-containing protein n=1 Tax=Aggregatimonas sangjinii TaxID=2583587 RepID=A0A5B7SS26_9FLAO|nr:hypothetical protein [Aggregatimonas sangjinii]QCX01446.1 hypothetical protein FGM00_15515 [Aggregatimonas sangjinii]
MKILLKITLLLVVINCFQSCSKDDTPAPEPIAQPNPEPEPEPENQLPTQSVLLSPIADAINVDVKPTFSWEAATDPDGDTITYEIYADTTARPSKLIGTTTETNFETDERLCLLENYNWKVLAKDDRGGETESDSQTFDTRNIQFSNATQNADFPARYAFSSAVFQNRVWLSGGIQSDGRGGYENSNDVWFSENGVDWTLATSNAQWPVRRYHTMTAFQDKLWIIGGDYESEDADVWNSEDGIEWNLVTNAAGFGRIARHTTTVFNDKLYVIHRNKVWFSGDGIVWTLASDNLIGNSRTRHTALNFNDKLWIIGASSSTDSNVMSSSDGISWELVNDDPFSGANSNRDSHASAVFDGKMWVIAGFGSLNLNDVWFSTDGVTWTLASENSAFRGRLFAQSQVLDDKIWLFGGTTINPSNNIIDGTTNLNDVWFID